MTDTINPLHGIPAVIGTSEDFPLTSRPDYLGQPRDRSEDPPTLLTSAEDRQAFDPLFGYIAGSAGTGKTTLAREYASLQKPGALALTSTTGISAVNLGEGTTINALLGYFDLASLRESYTNGYIQARLRALKRAGLQRILLDEVSLLSGEALTMIKRAIDEVNDTTDSLEGIGDEYAVTTSTGKDADLPPLGLTLSGDFGQLPVIKASFAFESPEWAPFGAGLTKLTKIWRQESLEFIHALHAVRRGEVAPAVEFFGPHLHEQTDDQFQGTTIFAKNDSVNRFNQLRLDALTTPAITFTSIRWGKQRSEWKEIPDVLHLKHGALVMVLANRRAPADQYDGAPPMIYANGDLGELVEKGLAFGKPAAFVRLQRTGQVVPVSLVQRDVLVPLEVGRRKQLRDEGKENLIKDKSEIVGQITYIPIRLAYASSCHRSQGLSLDQVQVNIRDAFFGSPQMLYVALSRARTLGGLRLVGSAQTLAARVVTNQKVLAWI